MIAKNFLPLLEHKILSLLFYKMLVHKTHEKYKAPLFGYYVWSTSAQTITLLKPEINLFLFRLFFFFLFILCICVFMWPGHQTGEYYYNTNNRLQGRFLLIVVLTTYLGKIDIVQCLKTLTMRVWILYPLESRLKLPLI